MSEQDAHRLFSLERFIVIKTFNGFRVYDRSQQGFLEPHFQHEDEASKEANACQRGERGAFPALWSGLVRFTIESVCPNCHKVTLEHDTQCGMCEDCLRQRYGELYTQALANPQLPALLPKIGQATNASNGVTMPEYLKQLQQEWEQEAARQKYIRHLQREHAKDMFPLSRPQTDKIQ